MPFSGVDLAWVIAATIVGAGATGCGYCSGNIRRSFANFHDIRVVDTSSWMCKFSETVLSHSVRLTGSFPIGFMGEPLTAHGDMCDGSKLSLCSLRDCRRWCPAMDISAPESRSTVTGADPFNKHM